MIVASLSHVVALVAGVLIGVLLREAWERIPRKGSPMRLSLARILLLLPESFRRVTGKRSRLIGVALVVAALAANAVVGFLSITTRGQLVAVVECGETYNREEGEARAAREVVARDATFDEIELWQELEKILENPRSSSEDVLDAIRQYRSELVELRDTRVEEPYPDPDLCRRLVP